MNTKDIYENIKCLKIINKIDKNIHKILIDTRKVHEDDLYIGIKGEKYDGNDFYEEAFQKGARIAILEKVTESEELLNYLKENEKCLILVEDTIKALGDLASFKRKTFTKPVVAITGSAGKTSTKDMVYSVLNEKYDVHKTIGNQNNHLGLPLTILAMDDAKDMLVVEMGMNHLGEISYLTKIAKPNVAIITNVGTAHIGNLGSRENILKAKTEILEGLQESGTLIINNDNDLLHRWYLKNKEKYQIKTFGITSPADFQAQILAMDENESIFKCQDVTYHVPIGGEHFIYNALVAITVGSLFNLSSVEN